VWEAAGTADTGDEHDLFLRNAEFRHYLPNLRQDRIVAAAGTPAHFLIGLEIFASEFDRSVCCMSVFAHLNLPLQILLNIVAQRGNLERFAPDLREADRVNQELRADEHAELSQIQLGHDHSLESF